MSGYAFGQSDLLEAMIQEWRGATTGTEPAGGSPRDRMVGARCDARDAAWFSAYCDAYSQGLQTSSFSSIHRSAASSCSISSTSTYMAMVPTWLVVKLMRVRAL